MDGQHVIGTINNISAVEEIELSNPKIKKKTKKKLKALM
jgi:hypothetical protein